MKNSRMQQAGSALAVLLSLGLIAACEDPAMEEPATTPPGQAPMAEPSQPPPEDTDH